MSQEKSQPNVMTPIYERRSIRHFLESPVERKAVQEALRAASWAPSGLNNQPWRFAIIWDKELKDKLAGLTRYAKTLQGAAVLVAVFLDKDSSYDYVKDCQAIGAAIQNMLLSLEHQGLGAVWIGEILKNKEKVAKELDLPERVELMAIVAVGEPAHREQTSHRRPLEELILFEK